MKRFIHPLAQIAVELQVTTFLDRRDTSLQNAYDEIQRKRYAQRVERNLERRRAPVVDLQPHFLRRQAN